MVSADAPYYRPDLALVHHRGFGFHADSVAPGVLALLAPIRERDGLVLEIGCGTGLLTRHLLAAGHRVLATDASPAMLDLARQHAPEAEHALLRLPDDPVPVADAVVAVGHPVSYLPDEPSLQRALAALAGALSPGGVLALDVCDLAWGEARRAEIGPGRGRGRVGGDWAIVTEFDLPTPDRFVRRLTAFTRLPDGGWRRDDEVHENVLVDTAQLPALLARHGVAAQVQQAFGEEELPPGLVALVGSKG